MFAHRSNRRRGIKRRARCAPAVVALLAAGPRTGRKVYRTGRPAFSLVELMIALIILGFGLLVVGAALPVGLTITRETIEAAVGEAAGKYGMVQVVRMVRPAGAGSVTPLIPGVPDRDSIFRPRDVVLPPTQLGQVLPGHEPLIKVRPLIARNVLVHPALGQMTDHAEELIRMWFREPPMNVGTPPRSEVDYGPGVDISFPADGHPDALIDNPVMASIARVYPPVTSDQRFAPASFFSNMYQVTPVAVGEATKALERRISWTAFYRRVGYGRDAGPDGVLFTADDEPHDPLTYEIIVVAAQRSSSEHFFPRQDDQGQLNSSQPPSSPPVAGSSGSGELSAPARGETATPLAQLSVGGDAENGVGGVSPSMANQSVSNAPLQAVAPTGDDTLAPVPWLVVFDTLPFLVAGTDYVTDPATGDRQLILSFPDPATLSFTCSPSVGELLPVGSIFIPAVNDDFATNLAGAPFFGKRAGFVPHAPTSLPIYKVVDRPDATTVVVENNKYYPWVDENISVSLRPGYWPVWVIPPSAKRDGAGNLTYDRKSPVISITRRYVRLREIP